MRFFDNLEAHTGNIACIDSQDRRYTYRELANACDRFAAQFAPGRKHLLFIQTRNSFESLVGYLGALRCGQAILLIDHDIDRELLTNLVQLYEPEYLWKIGPPEPGVAYTLGDYQLLRLRPERSAEIHPNLALLLSTSGSTGSPKLVRLTADNVDANACSIAEYLKLNASERPITSLPMYYSYGLSVINSHLSVGATLLLTNDSIVTKGFWDFFKGQGATSFAGVPYLYDVLRRLQFVRMTLPSLKTMTQAGGKLVPALVLEFANISRQKGFDFYVMYGQTEATARISYLPPETNVEKQASIGKAIPRGRLSLLAEDGQLITQPHVEGELVYEGPNVMMGYAQTAGDLARGDELGGRLVTGDVAHFDEEGFFYITGRKKRFLKIHGNRVNLEDVENYLKSKEYHCVCGGKDDALCIATTDKGLATEIRNSVTTKFGYHHSAVKVSEVDSIPVSSSGKILYEQLFAKISG